MAEQGQEPEEWQDTVLFRGRTMRVKAPTPEQIMVWQRTVKNLEAANLSDWNGADVLAAVDRTRSIIDSILLDRSDIDWLDDEMLAGRLGLKESSEIVLGAIEKLKASSNRAQRREAAKKTPARRKAPAKTTAPAKKATGRKRS